MMLILWSLALNVEARYEDVECCSEIYVSGGYEFQEKSKTLDMKARFQRDSAQLPDRGRFYHSHVIYRRELYLLGGFSRRGPTNTVFRLDDPVRNEWKKTFPMKNSRGFFDPVVFQDRIWACGGKNQSHFITSCESFSPETGWRDEPDIMESRFDHSTAVTSKGLYMIGGKTGTRLFDGEPFTKYTVEIFPSAPEGGARGGSFNPAWMPSVQLPEAIYGQSSTTLLDTIYVFGGLHVLSRSTRRSEVFALGPDSDEWLLIGNMNMARSRAVVVNFGYQLFIIGGCDGGCAAELFTPAISRFQFMNSWVKADGSFSEAGEVWPWSCSVDLCYKIYSEQSIEILRGLGYTTLGTTASTLYETTAAELELYDMVTDSSDPLFLTTESSDLILYETTPSSLLIPYETTASEDLLYIATTPPSSAKLYETTPDMSTLLEMVDYDVKEDETENNSFLDSLKDTKFTFTTSSPPSECTLSPVLCELIGASKAQSSSSIPAATASSTTAFTLFKKTEDSKTPLENVAEEKIILDTTQIYLETSTITTVAVEPTVTISLESSTQNSLKITTKKQSITGDLFRDSMNFNLNKKQPSSTTQNSKTADNTSNTSEILTEIVTKSEEQTPENGTNLIEQSDRKQEKSNSKQSSSPNSCSDRKLFIYFAVFIFLMLL